MSLPNTLGNREWMRTHEDAIKKLLPQDWTHHDNTGVLKIGFGLKLLGVMWTSYEELVKCMVYFEKLGLLIRRNKVEVRANPEKVIL